MVLQRTGISCTAETYWTFKTRYITEILLNEEMEELAWNQETALDPTLTQQGIAKEAESITAFEVYDKIPLKNVTKPVLSTRWVLKQKDTEVKARLVVRGFEQAFTDAETASPTPSLTTMLTLLTLGLATGMEIHTGDVSTAFLHAPMTEEVLVQPPPELMGTKYCPEGFCWKLKKALYGLRGAPLSWNKHITEILTEKMMLVQSGTDACMFTHYGKKLYLLLYVDDLLLLVKEAQDKEWFFKELGSHVLLKHTGHLKPGTTLKFLGRMLTHRGDNILITPIPLYMTELLQMYNLDQCKPITTTGNSQLKPTVEEEEQLSTAEHSKYRTAVGKLQWLVGIRPDLAYATKELARGLHCPTGVHKSQLKHLLRYIAGTTDTGLMLRPSYTLSLNNATKIDIDIYCDSDWAGCKVTRKSTTGIVAQILGCTVQHCSRTQATVSLSSTESETYAICTGLSEGLYIKQLLTDLKLFTDVLINVYTDSTGAKATATRTGLAPKTKHMQLRYLWIQTLFNTNAAKLHKINTKENPPDILTKYVTAETLRYLATKIGLIRTTVTLSLCCDFKDISLFKKTDESNQHNCKLKPTIKLTETSSAQATVATATIAINYCACAAMCTAYGATVLGGSFRTGNTDRNEQTGGPGPGPQTTRTVYFTNGNWGQGTGCYHIDSKCFALLTNTSGTDFNTEQAAIDRKLLQCKCCTVGRTAPPTDAGQTAAGSTAQPTAQFPTHTTTEANDDDWELNMNKENYMFSVTSGTDTLSAIISSCESPNEGKLFADCELIYQKIPTTADNKCNAGMTGYFWTVGEITELRHILNTGEYDGEIQNWCNWSLWTDCVSAINHWLMRTKFGSLSWQSRKNSQKHYLIGWKLNATILANSFICKELKTFNRLHWAHSVTGTNTLKLTDEELDTLTAFELKRTPDQYLAETSDWARHCQLSWDKTGKKPNWVNSDNCQEWTCTVPPEDNTTATEQAPRDRPNWYVKSLFTWFS